MKYCVILNLLKNCQLIRKYCAALSKIVIGNCGTLHPEGHTLESHRAVKDVYLPSD